MKPTFFVFNYYDDFCLSLFEDLKQAENAMEKLKAPLFHFKILDYHSNPFIVRLVESESQKTSDASEQNKSTRVEIVKDEKNCFIEEELLSRLYTYLNVIYESLNCEMLYKDKSLDETIELVISVQKG